MTVDKAIIEQAQEKASELRASAEYRENIDFWHQAWNMCTKPYTRMPDLEYLPWIPERLHAAAASRVLDLGCGSGWLSVYLSREGFKVTGIDVAGHALELGKQWAAMEDLQIQFDAGDLGDLPYPDGSFDAVVANSIIEHLPLSLALVAVAKLKTVLALGGTFVGCFDKVGTGPGQYYKLDDGTQIYTDKSRKGMMLRYFSDNELKDLFNGWTIEELKTLDSGSRFVVAHT
ncbi:MAG: class I SAM-dependent methyltransferase [Candidatus Melainabacteria bacterium]|nr:class I SAM-dependent methyltransferase [Candidatus Melainabacteria bacterium]